MNVNKKSLSEALSQCGRAVKNRTTLPILDCVRIEAASNTLTVMTTNLDVWIERRVECEGDLPACCVNFDKFSQLAGLAATETVSLEFKSKRLALGAGNVLNVLAITKADEFPPFPKSGAPVAVPVDCLADGIAAVEWLPNIEHPEDVINAMKANVTIELSTKSLDCLSFIGTVMAHFGQAIICGAQTFLIPYRFAPFLVPLLREPNASVTATDNAISVRSDAGAVCVKLSEGRVSDWRHYIKSMKGSTTVFEVAPLLLAAQRAQVIYGSDRYPKMTMELTGDTLVIDSQLDDSTSERIPFKSDPGRISLNARYLANSLKRFSAPTAQCITAERGSVWRSGDLEILIGHLAGTPKTKSAPKLDDTIPQESSVTQPVLI